MTRRIACAFLCLFVFCIASRSQNISSSVKFVLADTTGAALPGAVCTLTLLSTGAAITATSGPDGAVNLLNVQAGTYNLAVTATGFKTLEVKNIAVAASEIRTLGTLALQVGEVRESIDVSAQTSLLQLASAEKSGQVTNRQVEDIAVRGRDYWSLLRTVPGIVDDGSQARQTTSFSASAGVYINANRSTQKNSTVDGVTNLNTGANNSLHFEPNMDVIAEIKVMTSNYQAEFGRNAGGVITVITKSGSREFHGTGYDYYRHESLNANNFFNNSTGTVKNPYRYRMTGYTFGGPVYIPHTFNSQRNKLFFFVGQEYVGQRKDFGTLFSTMPTALERQGDFSQSFDVNGKLIPVKDPLTGQPFPGNKIPQSRINQLGQAMLNYFPLPNYVDPDPRNLYSRNNRVSQSGPYPSRQDMVRADANLWPTFQVYWRYIHQGEDQTNPFATGSFLNPADQLRAGRQQVVHMVKIFSPTLVNEFTFGINHLDIWSNYPTPSLINRSAFGNPPQWFPYIAPGVSVPSYDPTIAPDVIFGGQPSNAIKSVIPTLTGSEWHDYFTFVDNVSKSWGSHNFRFGTYVERNFKLRVGGQNARGSFDFSRDTNNPFDTGDSYSNAVLGNFKSYTEATDNPFGSQFFWNVEFYAQDNWRVSKRLTLDIGMRFYHTPPPNSNPTLLSTFDAGYFDRSKAPALYAPAKDTTGARVAQNPVTGAFAPSPLIGQYVPNSGDPANGSKLGGVNGYPAGLYTTAAVSFGPRLGFAWDVFGNGKTAVRGGFGIFHDRGVDISYTNINPPLVYVPTLYYGNLDTFTQNPGVLGPSNTYALYGHNKQTTVMNFSFGLQHQVGKTAVEASYVGNLGRHLFGTVNINPLPMYARFNPANQDPTQPGKPLPDMFLRSYQGYQDILLLRHDMTSNYHALQASVRRSVAHGLMFGASYTFSKALSVGSGDKDQVSSYFSPRSYNYGPTSFNRPHVFIANYSWDLPQFGSKTGWKPAAHVLDDWQISGMTQFQTGAPFTPSMTTTDGQDITGSSDAARISVIGDPRLGKSDKSFYHNFNTAAFVRTPLRSFGNAGVNILNGPGINNWDVAVSKKISLGSEARFLRFRTELYNAWNHTQFSSLDTTAKFDPQGNQTSPTFGAFTAARDPRVIQLSLKVFF